MKNYILKRDGRKEDFNEDKIIKAMVQAYQYNKLEPHETVPDEYYTFATSVAREIKDSAVQESKNYSVEEIQDMVERALMSSNYPTIAKAYILYRQERSKIREHNSELIKTVQKKIAAEDVQNQNANVDERSFGGRVGEASDALMKKLALDYYVSDMARDNHLNNEIYIHDLSAYPTGQHNCLTIPFDKLLANGFNTRQTDVRPAQSINTAFQLVAVIFQLQSLMQFGGVSASHLDHTMIPYVRKSFYKHYRDGMKYLKGADDWKGDDNVSINDELYHKEEDVYKYAYDLTKKETYQAVEGLFHNANTLQSRSGNQLPFTSINYGTCIEPEGRLVTKAILDTSIKGIGRLHRTSVFPCQIFQVMKGVNKEPGTPNHDLYRLALKSTALRLYPNYANVDWSGNEGYDINDPRTYFSTMGCRTANGYDINGFGQLKDGRGNICPVTIILPTLAMEAKEKEGDVIENFMEILDVKIHEAKDMLIERFEWICSQDAASAKFMYENGTMEGYVPEEGIRSALKHGTLAMGQIGLAETLQILIGCDHTEERGMELAKRIEQLFKDRCAEFKQEYKLNVASYFTPAENLCHTAMKNFQKKYGIIPKVSDKDFFTNSIHVPVWHELSPIEKIDIESQLSQYASAGEILYVELDAAAINNIDALETLVNYAMDKDVPYFAINVPNDMCMECGFTGLIDNECPVCHNEDIQRLRRVTGYLTGNYKTAFNKGKQQEVEMRYKHSNKLYSWHK